MGSPRAKGVPKPLAPLIGGVDVPERVGQQRLGNQHHGWHSARMPVRSLPCHGAAILYAKSLGLGVLERRKPQVRLTTDRKRLIGFRRNRPMGGPARSDIR